MVCELSPALSFVLEVRSLLEILSLFPSLCAPPRLTHTLSFSQKKEGNKKQTKKQKTQKTNQQSGLFKNRVGGEDTEKEE